MSKAANALQKSHKTPVVLYRIFLKTSLSAMVLATFMMYNGASPISCALPLTIAICAAILYALFYFIYKSPKYSLEHNHSLIFFQIILMARVISFLAGVALCTLAATAFRDKAYICFPMIAIGLVLCQLLHNNTKIFSNLSTFSENMAMAMIILTMMSIYNYFELGKEKGFLWFSVISAVSVVALMILQEVFFHFFNRKKHKDYTENKYKTELILRIQTVLRNLMIAFIVLVLWSIMAMSGGINYIVSAGLFEKIIGYLPISISLITLGVLLYNNFFKKSSPPSVKYDRVPKTSEFRNTLKKYFGATDEKLLSEAEKITHYAPPTDAYTSFRLVERALNYITENMSSDKMTPRDNGMPYYTHPIAVAAILLDLCAPSAEMLTVALLHDCIEDIPECNAEFIEKEFGKNVSSSVSLLTKKSGPDFDYHERKLMTEYLFGILSSPMSTAVKVADRMHNNSTMDKRPEKIPYKNIETKELYVPFADFASWLYPSFERFYELAKEFFSLDISISESAKAPKTEKAEEDDDKDIDVPEC